MEDRFGVGVVGVDLEDIQLLLVATLEEVEDHKEEQTTTFGFQRLPNRSDFEMNRLNCLNLKVSGATGQGRKGGAQQFHGMVRKDRDRR